MSTDLLIWPPAYIIKKHPRARHVKLKTSLRNGLELVVPPRFNLKHVPAILEQHKDWIIKKLAEINHRIDLEVAVGLPKQLSLAGINEIWRIEYIETDSPKLRLFKRPDKALAILGNIKDHAGVKKILRAWLKKYALQVLTVRLDALSLTTGLYYQSLSIRGQRSRWGSCSADKNINLNYKLLFLPTVLMDHILIHELCHTVQMNHSSRFWRLVAKFDSRWKEHCREVKLADKLVPAWVEV